MRRVFLAVVFCLVAGIAQAELTAADVPSPETREALFDCLAPRPPDPLACFDRPGVTPQARAFTRAVAQVQSFIVILEDFTEAGRIDVAQVFLPYLANTNVQMMLVNGQSGPEFATQAAGPGRPPNTLGTAQVLARYPQAFASGRVSVIGMRQLPGGMQRFMLGDIVTAGCRACPVVASSLVYTDYRDGALVGFTNLGWTLWDDVTGDQIAARLRAVDIRMLQTRLNAFGYTAGPVDGAAGPQTLEAFYSLKRDHCLPEDNLMTPQVIAVLAAQPGFAPAPCAPGVPSGPIDLGLVDGTYSAEPQLCPPAPLDVRVAFGDRAYGLVAHIEGDTWSRGEGICTIRRVTPVGQSLDLSLDCLTEGTAQSGRVMLDNPGETSFAIGDRTYHLCQAPQTRLPLPDGVYAHDARLCPGSTAPVPDAVVFEAGPRPLMIDGQTMVWDHSGCEINAARPSGAFTALDMSCLGGNDSFDVTLTAEITGPDRLFFEGFERVLCPPEQDPIFPIPGGWISANYGAHGPDDGGPETYRSGQFHAATDIAAVHGTEVVAPVAGDLIYYRQRIGFGPVNPIQTFAVLRDGAGRDWIFGHLDCTICPAGDPIGDGGRYPHVVRGIAAGAVIGVVLDFPPAGAAGDHLHLGLVDRAIVEDGQLLAPYNSSGWALVSYIEGQEGEVARAASVARALGFLDPMTVLPAP